MKILLLLFFAFSTVNVFSHEDTPIMLKKNGALVGLPEKYSPASFDRSGLILDVGNKRIIIPDCVSRHFAGDRNLTFTFAASWYHCSELLPNYISLVVSSGQNQTDIQILFNLETLEIFEINKLQENVTVDGVNYSLYFNEQEISENCKEEIFNSITKK